MDKKVPIIRIPVVIVILFYEILKLEYPVLWTGMKSFPAEGRGDLCYV